MDSFMPPLPGVVDTLSWLMTQAVPWTRVPSWGDKFRLRASLGSLFQSTATCWWEESCLPNSHKATVCIQAQTVQPERSFWVYIKLLKVISNVSTIFIPVIQMKTLKCRPVSNLPNFIQLVGRRVRTRSWTVWLLTCVPNAVRYVT